ncbi:hypothetical protein L0B53_00930 [Vibrio sp. SS-MA-C1-2]|uniref:hypothetical protein n=1 Tax=Vibrio sp. SS-MA-C1-2 TaxID=2908646 RepID=UPI001F1A13CB|nr:hypothetical protein [Vibrio sp. SS-MA-C1-2]UJF17372.1 hypothetical protein L0B53_00930 [Vibrio sp. SS-MA-C1-2]
MFKILLSNASNFIIKDISGVTKSHGMLMCYLNKLLPSIHKKREITLSDSLYVVDSFNNLFKIIRDSVSGYAFDLKRIGHQESLTLMAKINKTENKSSLLLTV